MEWQFDQIEIRMRPVLVGESLDTENLVALYRVSFDVEEWTAPYSISQVATTLERVIATHTDSSFAYWQEDEEGVFNGFGLSLRIYPASTIRDLVDRDREIQFLAAEVKRELASLTSSSIVAEFEFPASIKSACEQYLLYFVQFLRDLGIEADATLREQATKVLFSVIPRDREQALSAIYEALEAYLRLPTSLGVIQTGDPTDDIAVAQLRANVLHLRSQVILAKATLELKQATIANRDAEIALLKDRLDLAKFLPARFTANSSPSEPLIGGGLVAVKKHSFKFLEIDFPEILRKLKRRF
jgi:hypothetical protein